MSRRHVIALFLITLGVRCAYQALVVYFGGSGVVATELGLALARRGFEVHFIASRLPFMVYSMLSLSIICPGPCLYI